MALTDNLISYYKLDGNSNDSVSSNNGTDTLVLYDNAYGKINQGAYIGTGAKIVLPSAVKQSGAMTFNCWAYFTLTVTGTDYYLTSDWSGTGRNYLFSFMDSKARAVFGNGASNQDADLFSSTLSTNTKYMITMTRNGTSHKLYVNGSMVASQTGSYSGGATSNPTHLGNDNLAGSPLSGGIDESGFWSRELSSTEITELYNSGNGKTLPFINYVLSLVVGAFTLTGFSNLLKIGKNMAISAGSFTLTSINTLLKIGKGMIMSAGLFALTGYDMMQHVTLSIVMSAGSFILTSIDILIRKGKTLAVDTGNFVVTGYDTLFHVAISILMNVSSFTVTSINTVLNIGRNMVIDTGSFVLTSINILFNRGYNMIISTGNFILISIDMVFRNGKIMIVSAGTFTLTGINILIHVGLSIIMSTGNFILTGFTVKFPLFWRTVTKNISSWSNNTKNTSDWKNIDKTNTML